VAKLNSPAGARRVKAYAAAYHASSIRCVPRTTASPCPQRR
jgi:hypothetical protein